MQLSWEQVHLLVRGMYRNEKGYFRKTQEGFGGGKDALYMRLFGWMKTTD